MAPVTCCVTGSTTTSNTFTQAGWSIRAGGLALLACVAAAWASLLTWSQSDPSLTHAADGAERTAAFTTPQLPIGTGDTVKDVIRKD